ncbi:MAG: sensor histidine kinase, partial [Clostridia bacterium]|nr:sensor histidine kinase [Clostridia bacterium]
HGYYRDHKLDSMISFVPVTNMGWSLIIITPIQILYRELNFVTMLLILFGFILTLMIVGVNRIFANDMLNAINELTDRMQAFEKSGIADIKKSERKDEFGYLTNRFREMTLQITHLINSVYKEKIYRKNAQIKALQAQINPHFLYNTLETINWMAQLKGASEVSDMLGSLSSLLSAGIDNSPRLIPLEQELSYVKDYCNIMKFRYGDGIQFRYRIEEDCKQMQIPCLSLQPLVENAVLRGIDPSFRDGIILIRAYTKVAEETGIENFVIQVADNGVGIEKERLDEINGYLSLKTEPEVKGHVGLINVARRIKLFYGEQAEMKIESKPEFYCCVTCTIPLSVLEDVQEENQARKNRA